MKLALLVLLSLISGAASTADAPIDGTWLSEQVAAYNRTFVTRNGSDADRYASAALVAFVSGMLSVHHTNNRIALASVAPLVPKDGKPASEMESSLAKVVLAYVPLLNVPRDLTHQQMVAIIKRYLDQNPEKWREPADALVTAAFSSAFPLPSGAP